MLSLNAHSLGSWRRMRKASHESLNKLEVHRYESTQYAEALELTTSLLANPLMWEKHIIRTGASIIMGTNYDVPMLQSFDDPQIKRIDEYMHGFTRALLPGAHLAEFIPWLRFGEHHSFLYSERRSSEEVQFPPGLHDGSAMP